MKIRLNKSPENEDLAKELIEVYVQHTVNRIFSIFLALDIFVLLTSNKEYF